MNPVPGANGLLLNISDTDNAQDLDLAREVAKYFRLSSKAANEIIERVVGVVGQWSGEAKTVRLSRSEQDLMSRAFRVADNCPR
jgi:serine/threonine-protein kinase HipA